MLIAEIWLEFIRGVGSCRLFALLRVRERSMTILAESESN